jgi:flagellin-like protein
MKGISPIVASVLLIAITMSIAGILAYWSSSYVEKSLPSQSSTTCELSYFVFDTCNYNSSNQNLVFTLDNKRSIDLYNLTAFILYTNGSVSSGISLNHSLIGNSLKSFVISNIQSDFSEITVKPGNCPGIENHATCTRS